LIRIEGCGDVRQNGAGQNNQASKTEQHIFEDFHGLQSVSRFGSSEITGICGALYSTPAAAF
jgi:hypothetical protein